ncbi:OmpA family protein [Shimia thalassica]|uniref:OmpA family protein n=1 Tax=Shimia thalassica TaxID=1715693 RepID=UPI0026E18EA9|nr:OmpA family protein [Shimia thalassica]MDO6523808.1 OmpA family protein [Shimia thalassica]
MRLQFFSVISVCMALLLPSVLVAQVFGTVNFDFDSDQLDAQAQQQILEIADSLKSVDTYKPTVIVGYTDAVGGSSYNDNLGLRRAQAVAEALRAAGVPVEKVGKTETRGKHDLLISVSTPERLNRRVTVGLEDILAACRTYREVPLSVSDVGEALQNDLVQRVKEASEYYGHLSINGGNGAAFQMAGAAREDCEQAVGFKRDSIRKVEYAQKCFCSSARMQVALGLIPAN